MIESFEEGFIGFGTYQKIMNEAIDELIVFQNKLIDRLGPKQQSAIAIGELRLNTF